LAKIAENCDHNVDPWFGLSNFNQNGECGHAAKDTHPLAMTSTLSATGGISLKFRLRLQ
jgi:hypothetical protein